MPLLPNLHNTGNDKRVPCLSHEVEMSENKRTEHNEIGPLTEEVY